MVWKDQNQQCISSFLNAVDVFTPSLTLSGTQPDAYWFLPKSKIFKNKSQI